MSGRILLRGAVLAAALSATSVSAATVTSLVGDRDSFGTGADLSSQLTTSQVGAGVQEADDPAGFDDWNPGEVSWAHEFSLNGEYIISAQLEISTFDLEDDGDGDGRGGEPFDTTLFLDGREVTGAFDDVSTVDGTSTTLLSRNVTFFDLGAEFFPLLEDGLLQVILNPYAGAQKDHIAIDYASLKIVTSATRPDQPVAAVPLPLSGVLLLSSVLGLGVFRRRAG